MPKSCNECKLDLRTDICQAFCEWNAEHPYRIRATDRLPDCPLSEATEPCEDAVSRKAAVEKIRRYGVGSFDFEDYTPEQAERFVIKLLQDLPSVTPELCEDAVSRRKAFEYFVSLWECIGTIMDREEWEDVCKTTANELPPVTPKRKKGKWILVTDNNGQHFVCDKCGSWKYHQEQKFCGECGADMGGE